MWDNLRHLDKSKKRSFRITFGYYFVKIMSFLPDIELIPNRKYLEYLETF